MREYKNRESLYENIKGYLNREIYPFHMPGHKRNADFLPQNLLELDITEIPGMDVLSAPTGIIHDLRSAIRSFFGADESFLLVNGSSAGLIASVCAATVGGAEIMVPRNAHVSVYNGLALSGAKSVYYLPEFTSDGLAGGVNPDIFDTMPSGAAVIVVSPTYEGFVSDIQTISKKVHDRGGVLIVDEAHGAHFAFHDDFPQSALSLGADIVVNSLHKTLPALSQSAVLHVKGSRVDTARLNFFLNAVQTSSPSYILMSACDFMLKRLSDEPALFEGYVKRLSGLRSNLPACDSAAPLVLLGRERVGEGAIFDIDPGKLVFDVRAAKNAEDISDILANEYRVQMEMARGRHILAMTSAADTAEGFAMLEHAINDLNFALEKHETPIDTHIPGFIIPKAELTPWEAMRKESALVPRELAVGRVSAQIIAAYPPGIATVVPGERIPDGVETNAPFVRVLV